MVFDKKELLDSLGIDYLLVCATNRYLVEYSSLSENARYTLTGFLGSTGDALVTKNGIYLFVDGRYHIQADQEVNKDVTVVKLQIGQKQDDEIKNFLEKDGVLGIVSKKISQQRLENFGNYKIKLLDKDPINDYTEVHNTYFEKAFEPIEYTPQPTFISNLEEVSYLSGLRDFSKDYSSKIWAKMYVDKNNSIIFTDENGCDEFLRNYEQELIVDKSSINAHDYKLIKKPISRQSEVKIMKSKKNTLEIDAYKYAFEATDKAVMAIRRYIEENDELSEYDISEKLREEFFKYGAKSLSFNSIVAINQNSALAHYAKNSKEAILRDGDLVLIDCGAYYESGLATDITRVFVKGTPNELQKTVYTSVLKAFLNSYNSNLITGFEIDTMAHSLLDDAVPGFKFNHGLGHGIGINVHEAPPNLSQNDIAKCKIEDGMCFTIEPGLYKAGSFGVRLEDSCYKQNGKINSFVKVGYEGKLINYSMLNLKEKKWLEEFDVL